MTPPAVAALDRFRHLRPLWLEAPPSEPGLFTIDHIYSPALAQDGATVVLASTALGCTGLDLESGRARWRVPLPPPDGPVVAGHFAPSAVPPPCPSSRLTCLSPHPPAGEWPPSAVATAAGNTIEVRDEHLSAIHLDDATGAWSAEGRYAGCANCLGPSPHQAVWALRLDGGVSRVELDPGTGQARRGPDAVPAIQVLSAAGAARPAGGVYAALRLDTTLRHDAVVAFDPDGRVSWVYLVPPPASGPRVDPMALIAGPDRVVLFFDGRYAAALPPP